MTTTGQLTRITPYLSRLLNDDYIQEQIGQALTELRGSARRAHGRRASEALTDTKLRNQLARAFASLGNARQAMTEPPQEPHRLKRALLLTVTVLGGAVAWQRQSGSQRRAR